MEQRIIDQMENIVKDVMESFQDDFYKYDKTYLQKYDERFIWVVGKSHTHLARIGEEYLSEQLKNETALYCLLQKNTTIDAVIYMKDERDLVFYYDGNCLDRITFDVAEKIWGAIKSWALFSWQAQNKKELPSNFKIPVHLCACREQIKNLLKSEKASNLLDELRRRRNGIKVSATD